MLLLNGRSLTPARKVPLETMSLQMKERESSATIIPADMTGIQVNSWLQDETEPGKGIVWRVRSIQQAYATRTQTVQLEHLIATLKDVLLFGEHKAAQITGNAKATTCTAKQAIQYILKKQGDWVLGSFDYANVSNPYKFDGESLYEAIETVTNSLEGAWWSYDFTSYPFRLNITKEPENVGSEMRAGRNLKTITRTIDKTGMYTRFYPIGANDLHLDGDYVEKNTAVYGIVSKVETDASIDSQAELRRWANERLADHAEPTVTIDVEGFELAKDTGVSLDSVELGRRCRIPLPEYGTTILERIVTLNYPDKIHQPKVFKATLANNKTDITKIVAEALRKGGKGGRAAAKREKQDLAWFEDTNDHVSMCAIGIIGVDAKGEPDWIRMTELVADGNGLDSKVSSIQNEVIIAQTEIEQTERSVGMVVRQSDTRVKKYYLKKVNFPATGSANYLYYDMTDKRAYEWKNGGYVAVNVNNLIEAGKICIAINQSGEAEATINAKKIYLLGKTIADTITANYIKAKIGEIPTLNGIAASFTGNVSCSGLIARDGIYIGGRSLNNPVNYVQLTGPVNNEYTLRVTHLDGTYTNYTFSRATTLTGAWSGGIYKVTASPQGNTNSSGMLQNGDVSRSGNYIDIKVNAGNEYTGKTLTVNWTNYLSSASMTQHQNATGTKYFTAYYLAQDGTTYVSMGQHYWYHSGSNIGSRTVYY